jgi:hypothetical protein
VGQDSDPDKPRQDRSPDPHRARSRLLVSRRSEATVRTTLAIFLICGAVTGLSVLIAQRFAWETRQNAESIWNNGPGSLFSLILLVFFITLVQQIRNYDARSRIQRLETELEKLRVRIDYMNQRLSAQ